MHDFRQLLSVRPWWMNALLGFCAFMACAYLPWDLFIKEVAIDEEVWFGFVLHGWAAKATEPIHWAIYAAGAWGFARMRRWMWPWASIYVAQVAVGMLVWSVLDDRGSWPVGIAAFIAFSWLAVALWRARSLFVNGTEPPA